MSKHIANSPANIVARTRFYVERGRELADALDALPTDAPFGWLHFEADRVAHELANLNFAMIVRHP